MIGFIGDYVMLSLLMGYAYIMIDIGNDIFDFKEFVAWVIFWPILFLIIGIIGIYKVIRKTIK